MSDTTFPYDDEVADPYADDDTKNPHEETESDGTDEDSPPKRRPGRPKKAT